MTFSLIQEDILQEQGKTYNLYSNEETSLESCSDEQCTLLGQSADGRTDRRCFYIPARFVLALWSFLGFVNIFTLRMDINITILDMAKENQSTAIQPNNNSWHSQSPPRFSWSENQQYTVLSAFYYGYCSTQILGGYLSRRFSGKLVMGGGVLVTSLLALATPFAVFENYILLMMCRVVQGLAQGLAQPCMHTLWSQWAPEGEKSLLMAITYSGCQLGTVIATLVSSYMCQLDVLGRWQSVYYFFGGAGVVWSLFWLFLIHDEPCQHPRISHQEMAYIEENIPHDISQSCGQISWIRVLKSPALYAIIAAHFANDWGWFALTTCLPKYLKSVLHYDLTENGFLSSLPFLVLLITNPLSGYVADKMRSRKLLSTKNTRKLVNSIGLLIPSGLIMAVCFLDNSRTTVVVLLVSAVGLSGFTMAGYSVNHLDVAPSFAGILYGITNTIGTATGFIGPALLGRIADSQSTSQRWHIFFYITSAIFFSGGVIFLIFAEGEPQNWYIPRTESATEEKQKSPIQGLEKSTHKN